MVVLIIIALIVLIYIISFNKRDRDLDYKLSSQYQKSDNEDKIRTDIIKGLEITIKKDVLNTFKDDFLRIEAIKHIIKDREVTFYINIESIAQQNNISHAATFDAIFFACNYVRSHYGIEPEVYPVKQNPL